MFDLPLTMRDVFRTWAGQFSRSVWPRFQVLVFAAAFLAIRDVSDYSWALAFLVFVAVVNGLAATPAVRDSGFILRVHAARQQVIGRS